MEKFLLIAEKPSLMRELQAVYQHHHTEIQKNIDFTALSGHACCFAQADEYPNWAGKWRDVSLPLIPEQWKIEVIDSKKDIVSTIRKKIKENKYTGYICATDADREGNLIFYLLEQKLKLTGKIYRLWVHDLTEPAILKSFLSMVDLHTDPTQKHLTEASVLRSQMDWLIGINATRAATLQSGMLMNVGRVKAPTLKLVYDNSYAIDTFQPKTTYGVESAYTEGFSASLLDEADKVAFFEKKAQAQAILPTLADTATVASLKKEKKQQLAPPLYKLSDIQIEANKQYGYSADKTLSLVQSLYETHKLVSYPRCDCRFISSELALNARKLLSAVLSIPTLKVFTKDIQKDMVASLPSNKRYVNDTEVNKNSHTALMPTGIVPKMENLTEEETNILLLIYKRFVALFIEPIEYEKTVVLIQNQEKQFQSSGRVILKKGFSVLYDKTMSDTVLPDLKEGQCLHITENTITERTSTPPARLTQGDLIKAMEEIGKLIDDQKLKKVMTTAKGIGTPATRGTIISELIKGGFIESRKTKKVEQLYISETGKSYIENLKSFDIVSPVRTAIWESQLKEVEEAGYTKVAFETDMIDFTKQITQQILSAAMSKPTLNRVVVGVCPRCGKEVVEGKKAYGCVGYRSDPPCKFTIWKDNKLLASQGKQLTSTMVKSLLKNGRCTVKGLKSSRTGKKYDSDFLLDDTGTYVNLKFDFPQTKKSGK